MLSEVSDSFRLLDKCPEEILFVPLKSGFEILHLIVFRGFSKSEYSSVVKISQDCQLPRVHCILVFSIFSNYPINAGHHKAGPFKAGPFDTGPYSRLIKNNAILGPG